VVAVGKVPRLLELVPFTRVHTGGDSANAQQGEGERSLFFAIVYIVRALVFLASLQIFSFLVLVLSFPSARRSESREIAGTVKRKEGENNQAKKKKTAASRRSIIISLKRLLVSQIRKSRRYDAERRTKWLTDQQHLARAGLGVPQKGDNWQENRQWCARNVHR